MSVSKTIFFFFSFSLKINTSLALFLVSRGPNVSAVNYQNPGKHRKNKAYFMLRTLHYGHDVTEITLSTL